MLQKDVQDRLIQEGRDFMKGNRLTDPYAADFESDQVRRLPQPPLCKAPMRGEEARVKLPMDFENLALDGDLLELLKRRKSHLSTPRKTSRCYSSPSSSGPARGSRAAGAKPTPPSAPSPAAGPATPLRPTSPSGMWRG